MSNLARRVWNFFKSLKLTIVCLSLLILLVFACTLAQVHLGTYAAVNIYIRSFFVYGALPGTSWKVPIYPGGGLVGLVLLFNLVAAQTARMEFSWRKAGLWVIHLGLILLFLGEFVTGLFQVETQMAIEEGQSRNYIESPRDLELAVIDTSPAQYDEVVSFPEGLLHRKTRLTHARLPFALVIKRYYQNSTLSMRPQGAGSPESLADSGIGAQIAVREAPPVTKDDERNRASAFVEILAHGRSLGTWLLSNALDSPQPFIFDSKKYEMLIRPKRIYLPYTLTLKDFKHDIYPGTDIPKNFSSQVRLIDPDRGENRDVLIYMNHPLRYRGKTFYQASFGKEDSLSILQVVENPGWLIPYIAFVLVGMGLLIHFGLRIFPKSSPARLIKRRAQPKGAPA